MAYGVLLGQAELQTVNGVVPNQTGNIDLSLGTMQSGINMASNSLTGLPTPVNAGDAVTKNYTDTAISQLSTSTQQQISSVNSEIDSINSQIGSINTQLQELTTERKIIFIGDSYATISNWPTQCANYLGLASNQYWDISASGSCFALGTWLSALQNWVSSHSSEVANVGTILCAGGINDATAGNYPLVAAAIQNFCAYVKSTFTNCQVKIAYIGWALENTEVGAPRQSDYRRTVYQTYTKCAQWGAIYLPGTEMCTHIRTNLPDGIHPNTTGGQYIGLCLAQALTTGVTQFSTTSYTQVYDINGQNAQQGFIYEDIVDGFVTINFKDIQIAGISNVTVGGDFVTVGNCLLSLANEMPGVPLRLAIKNSDGSVSNVNCQLKITKEGYVQIKSNELQTHNSWVTFTPVQIYPINFVTTIPGIWN